MSEEKQRDHGIVSDRIASLEASFAHLANQVEHISRAVDQLAKTGTDWGVLAGWSTVLVGVLGGLGTLAIWPITQDISRVETSLYQQNSAFVEHIRDGHPYRVIDRVEKLEEQQQDKRMLEDLSRRLLLLESKMDHRAE